MHIALCGELGAGCTEVGGILSRKLGLKCISSADIIKSVVLDFRGVHPAESFGEFEEHVLSGEVDLDKMIDSKIDEFLEQGDTIVEGRSAFMLLNAKNAFRVLLIASRDARVKHVATRRNIPVEDAEEAVRASDRERRHMVERMFKKDWLDPHNYDMAIKTRVESYEAIANLIIEAVKKKPLS